MKLKEVSPKRLSDKGDRALARMARIAACDTHFGGSRALVLLKRLVRISDLPFDAVVTATYHSNTIPPQYVAYECPECGEVCFGRDNAIEHCREMEGML